MSSPLHPFLSAPLPLCLPAADILLVLAPFRASPSPSDAERTLALAILSRPLDHSTTTLLRTTLESLLAASNGRIEGLGALTALLQVASPTALAFLQDPTLQRAFTAAVEGISGTRKGEVDERVALVQLLVEAAGVASLRAQVRDQAGAWLESLVTAQDEDALVQATAVVSVIKLRLGREEGTPSSTAQPLEASLDALGTVLTRLYVDGPTGSAALVALEGLSYLTLASTPSSSALKSALIVPNSSFLAALLPATPRPLTAPSAYTIATLLHHFTTYPPLTPVERLPSALAPPPPPEARELVAVRNATLLACALLPLLHLLGTSPLSSGPSRGLVACTLLSLTEEQANRPALIAAGVAKDLRQLLTTADSTKRLAPPAHRAAVQALAKLLITANPELVFDPAGMLDASFLFAAEVGALDAPAPGEDEARLLRAFECLMALTNVVSLGGDPAEKLARLSVGGKGGRPLLRVVESAMLSANAMVQRAAAELCCNLVGNTDAAVEYYEASVPKKTGAISQPLQILLALCGAPDLATQLAAAGALAALVSSTPVVAFAVFGLPSGKGWETGLELVAADDEGLWLRGWDWFRSLGRWLSESGIGGKAGINAEEWRERIEEVRKGSKGEARREADESVAELFKGLSVS